MQLTAPVTLTIDGNQVEISQLETVLIEDTAHSVVVARLHPAFRPLFLWRGSEYVAAGDWTQAQADARVFSSCSVLISKLACRHSLAPN